MRFTQITEYFFLFQLNNFSTFLTSLKNSRVNHAPSWMDWCSKSFPGWKEDSEGWLCTDPCWICSEVIANILFLLTWLSMFRWPAYTWGQINAPPTYSQTILEQDLKLVEVERNSPRPAEKKTFCQRRCGGGDQWRDGSLFGGTSSILRTFKAAPVKKHPVKKRNRWERHNLSKMLSVKT